jgi:hypothetical protein
MTKKLHPFIKTFFIISVALAIFSCNRSGSQKGELSVDDFSVDADIFEDISTAKKIFYSLPSPLETAMLIKTAGADYNEQLLNPLENADNYTTNKKKALNLGIYTTDLSYASLFDQPQTSINYMNAAKKMADGLGILDAIDETTLKTLEDNLGNKEKIMDIISETFMSSSSYLKDNDRPEIATIVLIGGWIEGLYIATTLVGDSPIEGNKLVDRIVDQRLSYDIMLKLMDEYKDHEDIDMLKVQMTNLDAIMQRIVIKSSEIETSTDEATNVTTLLVENEVTISPETFTALKKEVKSLRNDFIL